MRAPLTRVSAVFLLCCCAPLPALAGVGLKPAAPSATAKPVISSPVPTSIPSPVPSPTPSPAPTIKTMFIAWPFAVYGQPRFTAAVMGRYGPQNVRVLAENPDGWALIQTYKGPYWAYLPENCLYIDHATSLFNEKGGTEPAADIGPQVVRVIAQDGGWLLIKTWKGDKWLKEAAPRVAARMDVPAYNQKELGYLSGCEIVSLAMMINYVKPVGVDALAAQMPRASDPFRGFRGDVRQLDGFTIFPPALAALTAEYLGQAKDMSGCAMDDLIRQLNANCPVVVWINGLGWNVHALCLTGYDAKGFFYNDPANGGKDRFMTYDKFYAVWNNPIIDENYGNAYPPRMALSY